MRSLWGLVLVESFVLGGASAANAQLNVTVGNPYAGGGAVVVNRQATGFGYPYYGYGYPGFVPATSYTSVYAGPAPMPIRQQTTYYSTGYAPGPVAATTVYAPIAPRPVYGRGYYGAPYPVRPVPMRPFPGRPYYYR